MNDWEISSEAAGMITAGLLVFANLVPLAGALTLGWDVGTILWLYWMESAVVGALNVIKMALAQGSIVPPVRGSGDGISDPDLEKLKEAEQTWGQRSGLAAALFSYVRQQAVGRRAADPGRLDDQPSVRAQNPFGPGLVFLGKLLIIGFFCVHYGIFMAGHAAFLYGFFGWPRLSLLEGALMVGLLFLSHATSFVIYFLLKGEYRWVSISEQMSRPYGRIVVMHVTIILGGILIQALGAPILALLVLVALKTGIDLAAHNRSHGRYAALASAAGA
jgi:cytochrome c oxidase subunit IV